MTSRSEYSEFFIQVCWQISRFSTHARRWSLSWICSRRKLLRSGRMSPRAMRPARCFHDQPCKVATAGCQLYSSSWLVKVDVNLVTSLVRCVDIEVLALRMLIDLL